MKILLIGCGKMGSAIMQGWIKAGVTPASITVVDPFYKGKIKSYKSIADLPKNYSPEFIILAVKPQNINEVVSELVKFDKALFISIIAGKTIGYFKKYLNSATIIRTMPNLPAVIGQGITAAVTSKKLSPKQKNDAAKLLKPCGKLIWLDDENLMDSVTAISGSGPAYVFLFADSLVKSAIELGLDEKTANNLVFETMKGSIALAENSKESLKQLKINVTSKGGTTEAALAVLENKNALSSLLLEATKKARKRAQQLAQ